MLTQYDKFPEPPKQPTPPKQQTLILQQPPENYLTSLPPKLQQILSCLLTQITDLQTKYTEQQKKLLKQIQQKDKLILSLTKINNTLMKQNTRMKKKSQAQFQYFVKRIAQTQCTALNDKKNLEEALFLCQDLIRKMGGSQVERSRYEVQSKISSEEVQNRLNSVKDLNIQLMNLPSTPKSPKKQPQNQKYFQPIYTNIQPSSTSISPQNSPTPIRYKNITHNNTKLTSSACIYPNPEKQQLRFNRQKNQLVIQI